MERVLVLTASYEPLNVCSLRRAHVLVWKGKAEIIEGHERPLRSACTNFAATATVHGFQVRAALGLRDTLFVVDRSYDEQGRIDQFTFSGRGWGHGVGPCQVGAYGLAVAGAKYPAILKKYYSGVKIDKIY